MDGMHMLSAPPLEPAIVWAARLALTHGFEHVLLYRERLPRTIFAHGPCFVVTGTLVRCWTDGSDETDLGTIGAREWIGLEEYFGIELPPHLGYRAERTSRVISVGTAVLRQRAAAEGHAEALTAAFGKRALQPIPDMIRRIHEQRHERLEDRIMRKLHEAAQRPTSQSLPEGRLVTITREELGRRAGCSRATAIRVLKVLQEHGDIEIRGRQLLVHHERRAGAA